MIIERIIANAERNLRNIRAELQDQLHDINTILDEAPQLNIYGDFSAGFNLSMDELKKETRELTKWDAMLSYRDWHSTMESVCPKPGEPNDRTDE